MIEASPVLPPLIHVHRHADNGFSPDDGFYGHVTAAMAHTVAFRRKLVYRRAVALGTAGGTTGVAWRWHCRTGYGATRFVVYAVLGLDDRNLAVDPYISVAITRVSTAATTTMEFHGGESTSVATDAPEEFIPGAQTMDVTANEVYTGAVTFANDVRVIALLVWEDSAITVDDANHPHSEWTPSAGSPIYDDDIENELDGVGDLLRGNGGLRCDWHMVNGTARTRTSATMINLIDNATTGTPTAATPGVTLNTTARRTISKAQDNVTLAVYGSIGAGSGTVVLRDTAGNDAATVTINGAAGWYTATGALTVGTGQKYDLMFNGDGVNSVSINAVSFYEEG